MQLIATLEELILIFKIYSILSHFKESILFIYPLIIYISIYNEVLMKMKYFRKTNLGIIIGLEMSQRQF